MEISPEHIYLSSSNECFLIIDFLGNEKYKFIPLKKNKIGVDVSRGIYCNDKNYKDFTFVFVDGISEVDYSSLVREIGKLNTETFKKVLRELVKYTSGIFYRQTQVESINGYIPAAKKTLDEADLANMIDASLDMWLTTGRFNDAFEKELSGFLGVKYAITVNSGSSANFLAVSALTSYTLKNKRLKKGDEVITISAGFPTTISTIIQNGMVPVFVDIDANTINIDIHQIEESISKKTKAVFVAHTLGNPFDIDKLLVLCKKYKLWLIEDNCDALGAKYNDKYTGSFGHLACCSFYPAHHITMGEGGAVLTNDSQLYNILLSLRDWGRDCYCSSGKDNTCGKRFQQQHGGLPFGYDHKYVYSHLGYNLKITDWQAAIALSQLKKLPLFIERRRENYNYLLKGLSKFDKYFQFQKATTNSSPSWFGFLLILKDGLSFTKRDIVEYLEKNNIGTRTLFAGNMLRQPAFVNDKIKLRIRNTSVLISNKLTEKEFNLLPNTDIVMNRAFWIGLWPGITEKEIIYIIETFEKFLIK